MADEALKNRIAAVLAARDERERKANATAAAQSNVVETFFKSVVEPAFEELAAEFAQQSPARVTFSTTTTTAVIRIGDFKYRLNHTGDGGVEQIVELVSGLDSRGSMNGVLQGRTTADLTKADVQNAVLSEYEAHTAR